MTKRRVSIKHERGGRPRNTIARPSVICDDDVTWVVLRSWRDVPMLSYAVARQRIVNGSALCYLPCVRWWDPLSWIGLLIKLTAGRTGVYHTAMAGWWGENLMRIQMSWSRDRVVRLSEEVKAWPGRIVVLLPDYKWGGVRCGSPRAVSHMIGICQRDYGWLWLLRVFLYRHTHLKMFRLPIPEADRGTPPPFCSAAYSQAWREVGFDVRPDLTDNETEPRHIFESIRMTPAFRLVP